ncbi:MAG: V-type ATPase subunit [Firmicutes bacterium]|nr:V-type ATPase subunit [Bacillota bacterium]
MSNQNIYANTIAEYQSSQLLGRDKLYRIAGTKFVDAIRILIGYGYAGDYVISDSYDIDTFIVKQIRQLFEFVKENSTTETLSKILFNKFIYSDAKILFKSRLVKTDVSSMLYLESDKMMEAFDNQRYDELSEYMQKAINELTQNSSAKEIDLAFENAMHSENLMLATEISSNLVQYFRREIDITNIITAYRFRQAGYNPEDALPELFEGGEISLDDIISGDYKGTIYDDAYGLLELGNMQKFRKHTGQIIFDTIKNEFTNFGGYGPFLKYVLYMLSEFRVVRFILICSKNKIPFSLDDLRSLDDDF